MISRSSKAVGAMVGAACGDALGWPNELPGRVKIQNNQQGPLYEFRRWTRLPNNRFYPYEEIIEAGEYSDDTQLILCVSRSLLKGDGWWEHFTRTELPIWNFYERGGGGATKRAALSWMSGKPPWSFQRKQSEVKKYFGAGGNGVAMRILPHIIRDTNKDFSHIASNIMLDGIATHGHPRALLGALVYGFALWFAIRKKSSLAYGELVEELIDKVEIWSDFPEFLTQEHVLDTLPLLKDTPQTYENTRVEWMKAAESTFSKYWALWENTKDEILTYLRICQEEFTKGALSFDDEVLENLQGFDPKVKGAGTTAAIASVYFGSRYATKPLNGIVRPAYTKGSDTDTIASMTGGLLGCICGHDWLNPIKNEVQDVTYIEKCATQLENGVICNKYISEAIGGTSINKWKEKAITANISSEIRLPDHRKATVFSYRDDVVDTKFKVTFRKLITEDKQSIYLKKISKIKPFGPSRDLNEIEKSWNNSHCKKIKRYGPRLPVASFEDSVRFYRDCLGLVEKDIKKKTITFEQGLVLVPEDYTNSFNTEGPFRSVLYFQVADIDEVYDTVKKSPEKIILPISQWENSEMQFFRAFDPDGNVVEIFSEQEN